MTIFPSAVLVLALAWAPQSPASATPQPKIDEYKMITYQAVFLSKGPKWVDGAAPPAELLQAHRAYGTELLRTGRAVIGGRFSDGAALRGAYIVQDTPEQARALASADPGVESGWWTADVLQWMGPEGWFRKPADVAQTETIYFGFLVTGANTAAITPEEQQQLMRGHLDYMTGQANLGALVIAGPLLKAGPRRGLIGYRLPTKAEALERASADPMVKAARMAPELYEWIIPSGTLKGGR